MPQVLSKYFIVLIMFDRSSLICCVQVHLQSALRTEGGRIRGMLVELTQEPIRAYPIMQTLDEEVFQLRGS